MKKVKYYKKNRQKKKIWFSENWGDLKVHFDIIEE